MRSIQDKCGHSSEQVVLSVVVYDDKAYFEHLPQSYHFSSMSSPIRNETSTLMVSTLSVLKAYSEMGILLLIDPTEH